MSPARICRSATAGSVLILALWVVFFLAALTLATGAHVAAVLTAAQRLTERVQARALAAAGAAQAAAVIMRQTNAWDGVAATAWNRDETKFRDVQLQDGGQFSVVFVAADAEGGTVTNTGLCGEEAKINLNRASPELLTALFSKAGDVDLVEAARLAAAILSRRGDKRDERLTEDAKTDYYPSKSPFAGTAGQPLRSVEELLLVEGVDVALYARLQPMVTVYGSGLVNINAASAAVLTVLAEAVSKEQSGGGAAESLAGKIVRYREAGQAFEKAEYAAMRLALEQNDPLTSDEGTVFTAMMGMLAVRSTAFSGTACGGYAPAQGSEPVLRVDFVWDAQTRRYAMWRER